MVMNNHSYEELNRRLLAEAKSELVSIDAEIGDLQEKRTELIKEAQAYELALQGYLRRIEKQESPDVDWRKLLAADGIHKERLKTIAKHGGGKIKVSKATDILYINGFIKSKKRSTAYAMVQSYLADMAEDGIFRKVVPGEYMLVGAQQSLPGVSLEERG